MPEKKDFATTGTESFQLAGQKAGESHLVLNIQDEKSEGIVLDKGRTKKIFKSGNPLTDLYHRINNYFINHSSVKVRDKATFFHLLSVMLMSGIPMLQALEALYRQTDSSPRLRAIIEELKKDIEDGESLSEAMLNYPDVFEEKEVGMVRSGEASGRVNDVLENLANDAQKSAEIKGKIKGAMMYPAVVFGLLIAVIVLMMVFVVPKLAGVFQSTGHQLPLITRIVMGISNLMVNHGLLMLGGILVIVFCGMMLLKTDFGKYYFDLFKLKMPIFGKLFQKTYLSRFARSLKNLLESGISIVKTFEITANSVGNEVYRKKLLLAMEDIKQGIPIAENLADSDLFPPMMVSMIDVGEKTAQLGEIAENVAKFYEGELDTAVSSLSKILEPVILIFIGVTVSAVVAAVMLPIMQLSNIAGSL